MNAQTIINTCESREKIQRKELNIAFLIEDVKKEFKRIEATKLF